MVSSTSLDVLGSRMMLSSLGRSPCARMSSRGRSWFFTNQSSPGPHTQPHAMFYNTLRFLALVIQPRPNFDIPPSASEPFYYYNTTSHVRVASDPAPHAINEPSCSFAPSASFGSFVGTTHFGSKPISLKERNAYSHRSRFVEAIDYAFSPALSTKTYPKASAIKDNSIRNITAPCAPSLRRSRGRITSLQDPRPLPEDLSARECPFSPSKIPRLQKNPQHCSPNDFHTFFSKLSPIIEDSDRLKNPWSPISALSCSNLSESVYSEEDLQLHLIDRASGVFIDKVCKATHSPVLAEDFEFYDLEASYRLSSYQERLLMDSEHVDLDNTLITGGPFPSMMLTLPTPEFLTLSAFNPESRATNTSASRATELQETRHKSERQGDSSTAQELSYNSFQATVTVDQRNGGTDMHDELEERRLDLLDVPVVNSRGVCVDYELDSRSSILKPNAQHPVPNIQPYSSSATNHDPRVSVVRVQYRSISAQKETHNQGAYERTTSLTRTTLRRFKAVLEIPLRQPQTLWTTIRKRFSSRSHRLSTTSSTTLLGAMRTSS